MPPQQTPILRKMEISDVIDAAIRLYRHNFTLILGIATPAYMPVAAAGVVVAVELANELSGAAGQRRGGGPSAAFGFSFLGWVVLASILVPLAQGVCCVAVSELYLGRKITIAEAYRRFFRRFAKLAITGILVWFTVGIVCSACMLLGALVGTTAETRHLAGWWQAVAVTLCIGPTLAWALWSETIFVFTVPVVVIEGVWGAGAMARSGHLVWGRFWRVLVTWLMLAAIVSIGSRALALPAMFAGFAIEPGETGPSGIGMAVAEASTMAVALCLRPVKIIGMVLLYYDARIRKEGFDLQVMASELAADLGHDPSAHVPAASVAQPALWDMPESPASHAQPQPPSEETPVP